MCHAARSGWGLKAGCARPRSSGRLALHAGGLALLLDVHADGEDEGACPHRDDKDVEEDGKGAAYADGLEKRLHVADEDDAAHGRAKDAGGHDADDVVDDGRHDDAAEELQR